MCHKKGHFSRNCPQHTWNKPDHQNAWNQRSEGQGAIVDDQSVLEEELPTVARSTTQTPQQLADAWLREVANERDEVRDLVMRDLLGQEDFQRA